jgi:hypothetical protein
VADDVQIEADWVREKVARQEAARREPPRPKLPVVGLVIAVVLVVAAGITIALIATGGEGTDDPGPGRGALAAIEIRARPPAHIRIDGKPVGTTPLTVHVPRRTTPVMIEATVKGAIETRQIVPDRDQTIDFTRQRRRGNR